MRLFPARFKQNRCFTFAPVFENIAFPKIEFTLITMYGLLVKPVRNILLSLCIAFLALAAKADTFTLTDGGSVTGDIVKFDDYMMMLHTSTDTYTNVPWGQLSQNSLIQLSDNPKIKPLIAPFILPTTSVAPPPPITIHPVNKVNFPEHPSLIVGLVTSPLGIFILLLIYGANLYAAYEIALMKLRPPGPVMGLSAVLPIIGPIVYLKKPVLEQKAADDLPPEPAFPEGEQTPEEIQIVEASWKSEEEKPKEKKIEAQVYARGKFTFNKRFIETKFASYLGDGKSGDAAKYTMELKTLKDQLVVERIMQVAATEVILETTRGQVTVALGDISEIKLNPKTA